MKRSNRPFSDYDLVKKHDRRRNTRITLLFVLIGIMLMLAIFKFFT